MKWNDGVISDVEIRPFSVFSDGRGWLAELFRSDEMSHTEFPQMGYLSETLPNLERGPHEHVHQTDRFGFFHGTYSLFLWDSRSQSPTYGIRQVVEVGEENKVIVTIPPGVVHAYKNTGSVPAMVLNFPNKLYAGPNKAEPVDEIRHEDLADSPFILKK